MFHPRDSSTINACHAVRGIKSHYARIWSVVCSGTSLAKTTWAIADFGRCYTQRIQPNRHSIQCQRVRQHVKPWWRRSGAESRMAVGTSIEVSSEFLVGTLWKNDLSVEKERGYQCASYRIDQIRSKTSWLSRNQMNFHMIPSFS
jgi:hypothetical protein